MKPAFNIVFMGTPDFAVESLKSLNEHFNIVGVITAPDRPSGRGQKLQQSAVKKYAVENNLTVLQPTNLKSEAFQEELKSLHADLQVVVAFRMLPESVWDMPEKGTINLHASLLPQYRGAAPINWAVINGETKSGVSTFFLEHKIDTGNVIDRTEVEITHEDTAGSLHDKLMYAGGKTIVNTVNKIISGNAHAISQQEMHDGEEALKDAPKIFKEDCKINWNQSRKEVYNKIRGLSPYPCAWTAFNQEGENHTAKIYSTSEDDEVIEPGRFKTDGKTYLKIGTGDGSILIKELQIAGKKRMGTEDFLRGFTISEDCHAN